MQVFQCLSCNEIEKTDEIDLRRVKPCPKCNGTMYRIVPKMRMGEILLSFQWITEEELKTALRIQKQVSGTYPIGKVLKITGKIGEKTIKKALEFQRAGFMEKAR